MLFGVGFCVEEVFAAHDVELDVRDLEVDERAQERGELVDARLRLEELWQELHVQQAAVRRELLVEL